MLVRYEFLIILNLYANEASYQLHADMCGTLCFHNVTTTTIIRKDDAWPWTWVFRSSCEKLPKPVCFMLDDRRIDKLIFFSNSGKEIKTLSWGFRRQRNVVEKFNRRLSCGGGMTLISFAWFVRWKRNFLLCGVSAFFEGDLWWWYI